MPVVHCKKEPFDVYIGRPSAWGNPFNIGVDGDRQEVIDKYESWIKTQPELLKQVSTLAGKTLGCWCHPKACHGEVLLRLAETQQTKARRSRMTEPNDLMIPESGALPAYAVDQAAAADDWGDLLTGMPVGAPPRVKLNGKQFVMVDSAGVETPFPLGKMFIGPDDEAYLKMMILAGRPQLQKAWYSQAYNPNDEVHASPDCFSNNGEHPDATVPSAQCDSCANCPKNAFGSGIDQNGAATGGKACTDIKIMAVFIPKYGTFSFKIPPGSFKNWSALGKQLKSAGIRPGYVVYLVGFDPAESYPVLTFKYGGVVPEQLIPALAEKAAAPEAVEILTNRITAGAAATKPAEKVEEAAGETADDLGLGLEDGGGEADLGLGDESLDQSTSPAVDKSGHPHDPMIHASTKTCTVDGFWKVKPGLSEELKSKAAALRAGAGGGAATGGATAGATAATTDAPSDEDLAASLGL